MASKPVVVQSAGTPIESLTVTVVLPAAPTVGNLLLAFVTTGTEGLIPNAGWTQLIYQDGQGANSGCLYRRAQAGDGSSWTFTFPSASFPWHCVVVYEISGADPVTPFDAFGGAGSGNNVVQASAMATKANDLALYAVIGAHGTAVSLVPPTGWVQDQFPKIDWVVLATYNRSIPTTAGEVVNPVATFTGNPYTSSAICVLIAPSGPPTQVVPVTGLASAAAFSAVVVPPPHAPQVVAVAGVSPPGDIPTIVDQFVVDDGHVVDGLLGRFGRPTVFVNQILVVGGVGSAQAFGALTLHAVASEAVGGVPSAQAFGAITLHTGPVWIPVTGVASAQQFGLPEVYIDWLHALECLHEQDPTLCGVALCGIAICGGGILFSSAAGELDLILSPVACTTIDLDPVGCA